MPFYVDDLTAATIFAAPPSGDTTGATDTTNLQAAINAALKVGGKLVTQNDGTTPYYINATLMIVPPVSSPDGYAYMDWEHHGYAGASIVWAGANNGTMISELGWKRSTITGVKLAITDGITGVVGWNIDTSVAHPSTSFLTFITCPISLGTGTNNVGWKIGTVSGGAADISFLDWVNCVVVGNDSNTPVVAGQSGWLIPGTNTLNLNWHGGAAEVLSVGVDPGPHGSKFFYGFGTSKNAVDFSYSAESDGTLTIEGGRYELGSTSFLVTQAGTKHLTVTCTGVQWETYAAGVMFNMLQPGALTLIDPYIFTSGAAYTATLITLGGSTGRGTLHVKGGAIMASDPFYTKSYSGWTTYIDGVGILAATGRTDTDFADTNQPRIQIHQRAAGVIAETLPVGACQGNAAPSTQIVFGGLLGLRAGDLCTGILVRGAVAAAGSVPTTARFGLADATGKILILSGNLNAVANWIVGPCPMPFTGPYTIPTDGGYIPCLVVNGTWGSTQPTLIEGTPPSGSGAAFGANAPEQFQWAGQTDLPTVGNSLTLTGATARAYYMAVY